MTRAEKRRAAREQIKGEVVYQMTAAQLKEHDRQTMIRYRELERIRLNDYLEEEFKRRQEMLSGQDDVERIEKVMCLTLSVPVWVLIHEFGWTPGKTKASKIVKFNEAVVRKLGDIFKDDRTDIRDFCQKVADESRVECNMVEIR